MDAASVANAVRELESHNQIILITHFLSCTDQLVATAMICLCGLKSFFPDNCSNIQYSTCKIRDQKWSWVGKRFFRLAKSIQRKRPFSTPRKIQKLL